MKKFIALVMLVTYSVFANGVVIRSHYCMNQLASRHLFGAKPSSCEVCGMSSHNNNGCCSDEMKVIKQYQDQQSPGKMVDDLLKAKPVFHTVSGFLLAPVTLPEQPVVSLSHSPPLISPIEIYKEIRVFRI